MPIYLKSDGTYTNTASDDALVVWKEPLYEGTNEYILVKQGVKIRYMKKPSKIIVLNRSERKIYETTYIGEPMMSSIIAQFSQMTVEEINKLPLLD